ncbi:MAG: alcohol dehydrogenase catalytic domain-containing protein [Clostridia bacterium]|nr:alcohol dehydrogenase catalytic domain-containing protein [Clostridia bacterium]MBQ9706494.1 alcohol dehydrogenase catalytic domain-containing protein [Clostridia bacterium]
MKAWILEQPNQLTLTEFEPTVLAEETVKVKIEQVLLSQSAFNVYNGSTKCNYPFVFGRNAVGVVSEVYQREIPLLDKMDRVTIEPYIPCGSCTECINGDYERCSNMQELGHNCNGMLQNFVDLPYMLVHKLPDNLSNEKALFVSYVAFCLNVVDALNLEKGRHIAIFSSTKTGLILAQLVAYYQAVPIFVSNNEELLETARELGVFYCFNNDKVDLEKELKLVTGGRMCREVVLFSDSDFKIKDVVSVASVNANICLAGYSSKESKISISQICQKHLNIFGVYNGAGNFASAINLLVTNTVKVDGLIGETISFDNLDKELQKITADELVVKSKIVKID